MPLPEPLPMSPLDSLCPLWNTAMPQHTGQIGQLHYQTQGELLFGSLSLDERDFPAQAGGAPPLHQATREVYRQVFAACTTLGFLHLARLWNYMPQINLETHGLERYRQFNVGRNDAFSAAGQALEIGAPAACALGTHAGPLTVHFLASRVRAVQVENPRQVSAYHYPERYGPKSPNFSRAALLTLPAQELLFISGTASIQGHASLYPGDVRAQTRETLRNLDAVLHEASQRAGRPFSRTDLHCKVYARHAADMATVQAEMALAWGAAGCASVQCVLADICRTDLLLEIEASARHAS